MLSEREQRQLEDIEHQLALDDPEFVLAMRGAIGRRRRLQVAAYAAVVAWLAAATVAAVDHWWLVTMALGGAATVALVTLAAVHTVARVRRKRASRLAP